MNLTRPRYEALVVLGDGPARYSNVTRLHVPTAVYDYENGEARDLDAAMRAKLARTVYWQAANWLIDQGLACYCASMPGEAPRTMVEITDEGRQALAIAQAHERVTGRRR